MGRMRPANPRASAGSGSGLCWPAWGSERIKFKKILSIDSHDPILNPSWSSICPGLWIQFNSPNLHPSIIYIFRVSLLFQIRWSAYPLNVGEISTTPCELWFVGLILKYGIFDIIFTLLHIIHIGFSPKLMT